ncbi:MAG: hypothetical protein QNJ31_01715 [Candidatus Caenarcaniphilales bacterium]|nr:hypothetical protein [Candidatus Caenarcaniphilales bacterium]
MVSNIHRTLRLAPALLLLNGGCASASKPTHTNQLRSGAPIVRKTAQTEQTTPTITLTSADCGKTKSLGQSATAEIKCDSPVDPKRISKVSISAPGYVGCPFESIYGESVLIKDPSTNTYRQATIHNERVLLDNSGNALIHARKFRANNNSNKKEAISPNSMTLSCNKKPSGQTTTLSIPTTNRLFSGLLGSNSYSSVWKLPLSLNPSTSLTRQA